MTEFPLLQVLSHVDRIHVVLHTVMTALCMVQ